MLRDRASVKFAPFGANNTPPPPQLDICGISGIQNNEPVASTAGRIMSMKNSSENIGNRTRDLRVCRTVALL
jgi:hypothetical protein